MNTEQNPSDDASTPKSVEQQLDDLRLAHLQCNSLINHLLRLSLIATAKNKALELAVCRIGAKIEDKTFDDFQTEVTREFERQYDGALLDFGDQNPAVSDLLDVRSEEERNRETL